MATDHTRSRVGVFIFRPAVTLEQLLPGLKQEKGFIVVDRRMATNLPLVYAAGDCTGQPLQIAKAVGEGNVAAHFPRRRICSAPPAAGDENRAGYRLFGMPKKVEVFHR